MSTGAAAARRSAAAPSIERFFQFSLLGLVAAAFCALASTGRLDNFSLAFLLGGVFYRGLMVVGLAKLTIPQHLITILATSYLIFYPLDFYFLSHDFFAATAHGVCFLGVARVLSARTNRDYLYTGSLAFVALMGAAALSTQISFFFWLALAVICGLGALTSAEIRRGYQRNARAIATAGVRNSRRTAWTLALMVGSAAGGILVLTAGLFFLLPRTARAAATLFPNSFRLNGFTGSFELGRFGPVTKDDRAVVHVHPYGKGLPPNLKWRGSALSLFNGQRWSELPIGDEVQKVKVQGTVIVADRLQLSRRDNPRMLYRVDLTNADNGTLFIAGVPEFINLTAGAGEAPTLMRTAEDSYRALPATGEPLDYEVSAQQGMPLPGLISTAERARNLRLPHLDPRIGDLARTWAPMSGTSSDNVRALAIEQHLQRDFTYSLDTGLSRRAADPLADFLFVTRRGFCEYFASAMAVMLRTEGIPARVATGFQSGYFNDVSGEWVLRASDAHAWVEAWIEGRGWVTFDPTPPGNDDAAGGWLQTRLRRMDMYLDAADTAWQQWVMAYNPARQASLAFGFRNRLRALGDQSTGLGWPDGLSPAAWLPGLWIVSAFGAAWLLYRFGPRLWTRWNSGTRMRGIIHRMNSGQASASDARLLYERMLVGLARRGYSKPAWFTPMEFARTLPDGERERVDEFTAAYNDFRYGGNAAGASRLAELLRAFEATPPAR